MPYNPHGKYNYEEWEISDELEEQRATFYSAIGDLLIHTEILDVNLECMNLGNEALQLVKPML
jgi:hypothetical protein